MQSPASCLRLLCRFCSFAFCVLPLYYLLGALGGLLGLRRRPNDETRSTVNMKGSAPWLHMPSPLDHFLNCYNLLYYFGGALGAPEDLPGNYLLAALGGNTSPSADQIKTILSSVGVGVDDEKLALVMKQMDGKDINDVVAAGIGKLASVPAGGAASGGASGGAGAAAAAEEVVEEVKEESEEEESDDDMGFSLFD